MSPPHEANMVSISKTALVEHGVSLVYLTLVEKLSSGMCICLRKCKGLRASCQNVHELPRDYAFQIIHDIPER